MLGQRRWTTAAVAVFLLAGGVTAAAAQEQDAEAPRLDTDALAERMALDEDGRADLEKLADLLERRRAMREGMAGLRAEMHGTMQGLASELTVEQFRELHQEMRATMRMGPPGDRGMQRGGMRGGGHMHGARGHQGHGGAMPGPGMQRGAGMGAGTCPWLQEAPDEDGGEAGNGTP